MDLEIPKSVQVCVPKKLSFGTYDDLYELLPELYRICDPTIEKFVYHEYYKDLCLWLSDDKGVGLGIFRDDGDCVNNGTGKTVFVTKVYPTLLHNVYKSMPQPIEINGASLTIGRLKEVLSIKTPYMVLTIDEFAREPLEFKDYGNPMKPMEMLFEHAVKNCWKILFASNFSKKQVLKHYQSNHLMDRIKSYCFLTTCSGKSSRKSSSALIKSIKK